MAIRNLVKETAISRRMIKVVRYTKFKSNPHGDGGSKRSVQIEEYWKKQSIQFIEEKFDLPKKYSKWQALKWCLRAIIFITKQVGWKQFSTLRAKFFAILTYALRIPVIYDKYNGQNVIFLWEYTQDIPALYLMKAIGAKVIAYPHNLESLVPTQRDTITHKQAPYWLYEEIERLKLCDEVYAISKEETWLLQLFGVNAELLIDHAWGVEPCTMSDVKGYKPSINTLGSGQVLHCPYDYEKTKLIVKEMIDLLVLDLCAAPGGKSIQLAQRLSNGILISNEIDKLIGYISNDE